MIAAGMEFFDELVDQIDLGEMSPQFRPIPYTKKMMLDHGVYEKD